MQKSKIKNQNEGIPPQAGNHNFAFCILHFDFGHKRTGFTLIEILISIAVIAVITAVMVSGLSAFRQSADLNRAVDGAIATLRDARRYTIESRDGSQWSVRIESSRVTLFKGTTFSSGAPDNNVFHLPSSVTISTISLQGGGSDAVFKRISGETDNSGTLTIIATQDSSKARTIRIHSSGLVEVQ